MGKFELINPILAGNIKTTFEASKPEKAAQAFWETLTSDKRLIVNELHRFMFTLRGGNNELHHFQVRENEESRGNVKYEIDNVTKDVEMKTKQEEMNEFLREVDKVKSQLKGEPKNVTGGADSDSDNDKDKKNKKSKRYKDMEEDSSSSDSDSDDEFDYARLRKRSYNTPISYWWYSPLIYRVRKIFTPVFVQPVAPYVQLWLPMR
jgi:hypothetical protein